MRLRNWIAVLVSVLLLAGAGVAGILVNRSTVKAVEDVHEKDTTALGTNNGTLTGQLQKNSTLELAKLLGTAAMRLGAADAKDRFWRPRAPRSSTAWPPRTGTAGC
jgi:hypothetical protein